MKFTSKLLMGQGAVMPLHIEHYFKQVCIQFHTTVYNLSLKRIEFFNKLYFNGQFRYQNYNNSYMIKWL